MVDVHSDAEVVAGPQTIGDLAGLLRQLRRRQARRKDGAPVTFRALAAATGWSVGVIADYFNGNALAAADRFDALVQLLGASPAEQWDPLESTCRHASLSIL